MLGESHYFTLRRWPGAPECKLCPRQGAGDRQLNSHQQHSVISWVGGLLNAFSEGFMECTACLGSWTFVQGRKESYGSSSGSLCFAEGEGEGAPRSRNSMSEGSEAEMCREQ